MELIKKMPADEAARWADETLDEMLGRGGCTAEDEDVRALETLRDCASTMDNATLAGSCLILGGLLCAALALVIGLCGSIYVPMGRIAASQQLGPYALGFALFAVAQFTAVRLTRRGRR